MYTKRHALPFIDTEFTVLQMSSAPDIQYEFYICSHTKFIFIAHISKRDLIAQYLTSEHF